MSSIKERRTDTHIYFVGGPLSQWYHSPFEVQGHKFTSCEQFMMAGKAALFADTDMFNAIMLETNPRKVKELGRQVRGFDPDVWNEYAKTIVANGNYYKFTSTPEFKKYLLDTGDLYIVEGAAYDPVWGVKVAWDDPQIEDPINWKGTNWLGECLMLARQKIREKDAKNANS